MQQTHGQHLHESAAAGVTQQVHDQQLHEPAAAENMQQVDGQQLHEPAAAAAADNIQQPDDEQLHEPPAGSLLTVLYQFINAPYPQTHDVQLLRYIFDMCKLDIEDCKAEFRAQQTAPEEYRQTALDHMGRNCRVLGKLLKCLKELEAQQQQQPADEHEEAAGQQHAQDPVIGQQGDEHQPVDSWKSESQRIQTKILDYFEYFCLLVSRRDVSVEDVLDELRPALDGYKFLLDPVTGLWCGPEDCPLILDQDLTPSESNKLCRSAPVPIIPVRSSAFWQSGGLVYASGRSNPEPTGKILVQLFNGLGVLTVSQAKKARSLHETEMLLPRSQVRQLKKMLRETAANMAKKMFPQSIATHVADTLDRRVLNLQIRAAPCLKVQYVVPNPTNELEDEIKDQLPLGDAHSVAALWLRPVADSEPSTLLLNTDAGLRQEQTLLTIASEFARIVLDGGPCAPDDQTRLAQKLVSRKSLPTFFYSFPYHSRSGHSLKAVIMALIKLTEEYVRAAADEHYNLDMRRFFIKAQQILSCLDLHDVLRIFTWQSWGGPLFDAATSDPVKALLNLLTKLTLHPVYLEARFFEPLVPVLVRLLELSGDGKAGKLGEILLTLLLSAVLPKLGGVITNLEDIRPAGGPYDIKIRFPKLNRNLCIEVKSTEKPATCNKAHRFKISRAQLNEAERLGSSYIVVRVYGMPGGSSTPRLGFLFVRDPALLCHKGWIRVTHRKVSAFSRETHLNVGPGLKTF